MEHFNLSWNRNENLVPLKISPYDGTKLPLDLPDGSDYELCNDRILVYPIEAEEITSGGIYIPETAQEKPRRGIIILAGPGTPDERMAYKRGDIVDYGKYDGTEILWEGKHTLLLLRAVGIFGRLLKSKKSTK